MSLTIAIINISTAGFNVKGCNTANSMRNQFARVEKQKTQVKWGANNQSDIGEQIIILKVFIKHTKPMFIIFIISLSQEGRLCGTGKEGIPPKPFLESAIDYATKIMKNIFRTITGKEG